jgi:hypothetical protein
MTRRKNGQLTRPAPQPTKALTSHDHQRLEVLLDVAAMALQEVGVRLSLVAGYEDPTVRLLGQLSLPHGCLETIRQHLHTLPTQADGPHAPPPTAADAWACHLPPEVRLWLTLQSPPGKIPFQVRWAADTGVMLEITCCGVPYVLDPLGGAPGPEDAQAALPTPDASVIALFTHWQVAHDLPWQRCITVLWRLPILGRRVQDQLERTAMPATAGHYY